MQNQMKIKKNISYIDAKKITGWAFSQGLPNDAFDSDKNVELQDVILTPDGSDIGCFIDVIYHTPINVKEKQRNSFFVLKI